MEAIIGLIGVVVGGVLTGVVQRYADWRRERAELHAAIRLLHLELLAASAVLSTALTDDNAARLKGAVPVTQWSQFSGLIAKKAEPAVWRALAGAYGNLVTLRADSDFMEARPILPNEREAIEQYLVLVGDAEMALRQKALSLPANGSSTDPGQH